MQFDKYKRKWARFWMRFSGSDSAGRWCTRIAAIWAPPYKGRKFLAGMNPKGYISPRANVFHSNLMLGKHIFLGDGVEIFQSGKTGQVSIGDFTCIHRDCIIETGRGGNLRIGNQTHIQPRCQFSAYVGSIHIGDEVQIAPNCAFYPYDHEIKPGQRCLAGNRCDCFAGCRDWTGRGCRCWLGGDQEYTGICDSLRGAG